MSTVQIVNLTTDRPEELHALAEQWWQDTEGRRRIVRDEVYTRSDDPQAVVAVAYFADAADQQVNNDLPETQQLAETMTKLALKAPTFVDLVPVTVHDVRIDAAAKLRGVLAGDSPEGVLTADADIELVVPQGRLRAIGPAGLTQVLSDDAPGHQVETWDVQVTDRGFLVESVLRTTGQDVESVSINTIVATVEQGVVSRLLISCGGNWQPELVASIVERTGAIGVRADGSEVRS